ncbi:MAG TPA: alpha/beta hydrolase [Mycobacteriales bacterium]|jgi:pimeloyl-ACP methyl ester carboxylesterase|nr:alpha/beta hydrolase [Mycobacteriales bacterium]
MDDLTERLAAFEPEDLRAQVQRSWEREAEVETPEALKQLLDDQMPWHFADPRDPRIADYNARTAGMVGSPDVIRHFAAAGYGGIEVEDRLASVTHPVLAVTGRYDRTCPVEAAEVIAHGVPGAELAIFEHSGHMTFVEEQGAYLETVRAFLDRVRR